MTIYEQLRHQPSLSPCRAQDPLVTKGNLCARTANELLKGFKHLSTRQGELRLPLYAAHGSQDRCTSLPAVRRLAQGVSSTDVTLHVVEGECGRSPSEC